MVKFRVKCSVTAPGLGVVVDFTAARENGNDSDKIRTGSSYDIAVIGFLREKTHVNMIPPFRHFAVLNIAKSAGKKIRLCL